MVESEICVHVLKRTIKASENCVPAYEIDSRVWTYETGHNGECWTICPYIAEYEFWFQRWALCYVPCGNSIR